MNRAGHEPPEWLELAVSGGKVGLWDLDLQSGRIKLSREWQRQLGYDEGELPDALEAWQERLHPDDAQRAIQAMKTYLKGNESDYEAEFRLRHRDGSYRYILARGTGVKDTSGTRVRLVGSHVDITELAELRAQLLHAQRMECVGQLAGGIAHDFNNLLTVINGTADLARMRLPEGDPLATDFLEIQRAGDRAAALTRQLLIFSRRRMLKPESVYLSNLVNDLKGMLRRLIPESIELIVNTEKGLGWLRADAGHIEQVVVSLVVNAQDAMPDGGTLEIATKNVELGPERLPEHLAVRPGPHVLLSVRDTGTGMDAATLGRIFEPFFTTKGPGRGSGLGLSTVYGIVRQCGGGIDVRSAPGQGTCVDVFLPQAPAPAAAGRRTPASPVFARGTETILVVEDEAPLRNLLTRLLSSAGYLVLVAASGPEALETAAAHEGAIHLVITDMVLPGMNGRELAERLVRDRPATRILFTSGYTDDAILRQGLLDETAEFIAKPYAVADLSRKVRDLLGPAGTGGRTPGGA